MNIIAILRINATKILFELAVISKYRQIELKIQKFGENYEF